MQHAWSTGLSKSTAERRKKISDNHHDVSGHNNPRARSVVNTLTGEIFLTIKDAALNQKVQYIKFLTSIKKNKSHFKYI